MKVCKLFIIIIQYIAVYIMYKIYIYLKHLDSFSAYKDELFLSCSWPFFAIEE